MIMKNFSVATRKIYLRTLKRYLRFHKSKYGQRKVSQESAKQFILYKGNQADLGQRLFVITQRCVNTLEK